MTFAPFCTLECNRAYHEIVVAPDTQNITEPYCLNCGAATLPSRRLPRSRPQDVGSAR